MTPKQALIEFLATKQELLQAKHPEQVYVNHEDYEEVLSWPDELCQAVLDNLHVGGNDGNACPWCVKSLLETGSNCTIECDYGARHGWCAASGSRYGVLTKDAPGTATPLTSKLGTVKLRNKLRALRAEVE